MTDNPKEINFVENVISGMSRTDAYIKAFGSTAKKANIYSLSSRVWRKESVQRYYNDRMADICSTTSYTRERAIADLIEQLIWLKRNRTASDAIRKVVMSLVELACPPKNDMDNAEDKLKELIDKVDSSTKQITVVVDDISNEEVELVPTNNNELN